MNIDWGNRRVIKEYQCAQLIDEYHLRIAQIESISKACGLLIPTCFSVNENTLYYYQEYIRKKSIPLDVTIVHELLLLFAQEYTHISADGFVHGDINRKNVLYDGQRLLLCDLEPSLKQVKNGKIVLMYTPPYISKNDFLAGALSSSTDKIGFFFLCRKLLGHKTNLDVNIVQGYRNTFKNHFVGRWHGILPFEEERLPTLGFTDILSIASDSPIEEFHEPANYPTTRQNLSII